jgi:hypothetical protein
MKRSACESKGFVFLAVLGVMAVTILLAFAMSGATQYSYHTTGLGLLDVQEEIMARSAADYALALVAQKKMPTDGKPQPFTIVSDHLRARKLEGNMDVAEAAPAHPIYKLLALAHRPGDVWVHVVSPQMQAQYGRGERWLLCNTTGKRLRPIDVTSAFRGALTK